MTSPDAAYIEVEKLIRKFKTQSAAQRKSMNENATRQGYILPLFTSLGWDISNVNEVSPEEKVSRGFVDFSFRLEGVPRFFLETKKASEDLNDPRWVKQAIDYAWTKNVTWALLSDFEGLRVFNAEWKESNPFRAEFLNFDLDTYLSHFERLWWLSREQTAAGRLNAEAEQVGKKARRLPVSQHLFDDLKTWRAHLFRDLKGFNPMYSAAQVDEAVLRMLNRLIFIRTAEDRQVEPSRLRALVRELKDRKQYANLWVELSKLFREMDGVYNSELFARHFSEELYVTPTVLEEVIEGLYEANYVGYNFNAIESDVLGTAYEQYLGSMVTQSLDEAPPGQSGQPYLMPQPAMSVQERRQKRKSQGIYYTPGFVTKYIVQQTVGRWLAENGYHPARAPRILDMACGSGSFLIEAFDVLDAFVARQRGHAYGEQEGVHDAARRLELLTTCIYGVDKDKQAVDVARLNLLLRALHSREKLPMLHNLHHADSLHPETWEDFSEVMKEGGFDIIIGNPPYVRQETLGAEFKEFAQSRFETYAGSADLYVYFIELAQKLIKPNGFYGVICSNKFLRSSYGKRLRTYLAQNSTVLQIVDLAGLPVFSDVTVRSVIIITTPQQSQKTTFRYLAPVSASEFEIIGSGDTLLRFVENKGVDLPLTGLNSDGWSFTSDAAVQIIEKIKHTSSVLNDYVNDKPYFGIKTGFNDAFILDRKTRDYIIAKDGKSTEIIKPVLTGRDVRRYSVEFDDKYLIWTYIGVPIEHFPTVFEHLNKFKEKLINRWDQGNQWWELRACDYYDKFTKPKIIFPDIATTCRFVLDRDGYFGTNTTYFIPSEDLYLLGLLNSKLAHFYFSSVCAGLEGGGTVYLRFFGQYIEKFPVHLINSANSTERVAHDAIVHKVEQMLALQKQRAQAKHEKDDARHSLGQKIAKLDAEIDGLVYRLYGLTEEEIKVVEDG